MRGKSGYILLAEPLPHLVVTLEGFEGLNVLQWGGMSHPLYGLPGCHHPHVLHGDDRVQEQLESLLVVGSGEPAS